MPGDEYIYNAGALKAIPYREIDLSQKWEEYDISHDLTVKGMKQFSFDWNNLIA